MTNTPADLDTLHRQRDNAADMMTRIARDVVELAPGDPDIGRLHADYCVHLRLFAEAAAESSVRAFLDASEADFLHACREHVRAAGDDDADTEETVRIGDAGDDGAGDDESVSRAFAAAVSEQAATIEDAWSLLASRLLGVVDERIAALRVEMREEMDARIAIPDYVDKPGA